MSPDGKYVAAETINAAQDAVELQLLATDGTGQPRKLLESPRGFTVIFGPDSKTMAYISSEVSALDYWFPTNLYLVDTGGTSAGKIVGVETIESVVGFSEQNRLVYVQKANATTGVGEFVSLAPGAAAASTISSTVGTFDLVPTEQRQAVYLYSKTGAEGLYLADVP